MDSTSSAPPRRRFRVRDESSLQEIMLSTQDSITEELVSHVPTPTDSASSVSSDAGVNDSDLDSMTAKGIQNLCSELLELKNESDEDFRKSISSNYSAFLRIFDDVEGLESEIMRLKYQAATQKRVIKDLRESNSLKVLSEEIMESLVEESLNAQTSSRSILEAHTEDVSEILDILLSELRLDETLSVLEMEDRAFQSMHFGENFSSDEMTSYNSTISEKRAMLEDQFTLQAKSPRVSAPELQKALVGLCKLGNSHFATQLLLDYYDACIKRGTHDLHSSKAFQHGLYIQHTSQFTFSIIAQAARSLAALHGEASSYTPEFILWANEQTEAFGTCFEKYIKSISEINGCLLTAVDAAQCAIAYSSLLDNQKLGVTSCLTNHIRPCMEQTLQTNVNHYKKVISIFTSTDSWIIGRYLVSGILSKGRSFTVVDKKQEYCLLTNSGRKFVTLFQDIIDDSSPLISLQLEDSVLRELMELFTEYIIILEKAITSGANLIEESGSKIYPADSLVQGVSVVANSLTLGHIFPKIIRNVFKGIPHLKFEIDNYIQYIQDTHVRLRAHFVEQVMQNIFSSGGGLGCAPESRIIMQSDSDVCHQVPSVPYQGFYLELRKLQKFAEDNYFEMDWLTDLLRELMEAIVFQIANGEETLAVTKDLLMEQNCTNLIQFILDMQFLVEVARCGGFLSDNILTASVETVARIKSGLNSSEFTLESCVDDQVRAADAAMVAIKKLDELDEKESITIDMANNLEGETTDDESQYATDLFEDNENEISPNQSFESPKDLAITHASEMVSHLEKQILELEDNPSKGESFDDSSAVDCSEPFKERLLESERDESNSRNPNNDLLEEYLAIDDAEEASVDETISPQGKYSSEEGLPISTSGGTIAAAPDINEPPDHHGEINSERTFDVLKED